jgi:hypothetical protein
MKQSLCTDKSAAECAGMYPYSVSLLHWVRDIDLEVFRAILFLWGHHRRKDKKWSQNAPFSVPVGIARTNKPSIACF